MAEFIVNPRRAPRAPARCRAAISGPGGAFESETEDIGPRGCQVIAPRPVKKGEVLEIRIGADAVPDPLRVTGKVAWVSAQPPWRVGIAFEEAHVGAAERWFEKLVASMPGAGTFRKVPERIPLDAMVYLGPPPRFVLDFTADEAALLRAIASGARLDELKARWRDRWPAAQTALFSLLARHAVTLARGHAAHPEAWKKILTEVEAALAVESMGSAGPAIAAPPPAVAEPARSPTPVPMRPLASPLPPPRPRAAPPPNPAASPWGTAPLDPSPSLELGDPGPALDVAAPTPAPRGAARALPRDGWAAPAPTPPPAAVGWRDAAPVRSPEAQALYERALLEIDAGHVNGAIALLRKALTHSPGDPEIAATLGKLAFKDRTPRTK